MALNDRIEKESICDKKDKERKGKGGKRTVESNDCKAIVSNMWSLKKRTQKTSVQDVCWGGHINRIQIILGYLILCMESKNVHV